MKQKLTILVLMACMLSGCGIYDTWSPPEMYVEDDAEPVPVLSWRELFTDARLQSLIETGLRQNTDLGVARLRVEEAEAALMSARRAWLPSLSFSPEVAIGGQSGNVSVPVGWSPGIFGRNTNAVRGASEALEGSLDYVMSVQSRLVAAIADSYYTLMMLDCQVDIGERTLESWEESIHTLESLKIVGGVTEAAVLQARANRMLLESSVLDLRRSILETEGSLSALLVLPSGTMIERGVISDAVFPEDIPEEVPVRQLASRPDVRQAEHELAQAFYATNAARAAFYPEIYLSGTFDPSRLIFDAVASLTQPLLDGGRNMANLKAAKARQEQAALRFGQTLADAGKEVNDALVQFRTSMLQVELGQGRVEALREAVRNAELLMLHSSTTYLEVLTAQQALLDAELELSRHRFDNIQGVINLYCALGGGVEFGCFN